ncbi:MAG: hypothetical protein K6G55_07310 [Selenomonadaceae bacterium]|nr:hypothetical protein [Selenomonadaceae bacterium]
MDKYFKIVSRIGIALLMICAVIFPGKTFAADNPNSEGMKAFREALTSDSDSLDRIFRQDIYFASPFIISELEIYGTVEKDEFISYGDFSMWVYNDDGTQSENIIPYYMVQNGKDMTIYFKTDKKWQKFTTPSLAAAVMDMLATPTEQEVEEIIADTKDVTILQDNDYRRIMLIRVDGNRIADSFKNKSDENPADKGTATDSALQEKIVGYMDSALRKADVWYMWTIDKRDWHTVAMQYNFSGIIQEMARAALNDPEQQWPDEISNMLETIAYYSEIRAYTTYPADPKAKKNFVLPKEVLKAKPVDSLSDSVKITGK